MMRKIYDKWLPTFTLIFLGNLFLFHTNFFSALPKNEAVSCPDPKRYGKAPPQECREPMDPNLKPKTYLERWFTKEMFDVIVFKGWISIHLFSGVLPSRKSRLGSS
jgi:hypothetical protein